MIRYGILMVSLILMTGLSCDAGIWTCKHFTVEDGLPTNTCYRIIQDEKGFVWICTEKGIVKYDGYTFLNYNTKNMMEVQDVWGIFQDRDYRKWLISYRGGNYFIYRDSLFSLSDFFEGREMSSIVGAGTISTFFSNNPIDTLLYTLDKENKVRKHLVSNELVKIFQHHKKEICYFQMTGDSLFTLLKDKRYIQYSFRTKLKSTRYFESPPNVLIKRNCEKNNTENELYFNSGDSVFMISHGQLTHVINYSASQLPKGCLILGKTKNYFFFSKQNEVVMVDKEYRIIPNRLPSTIKGISQIFEDHEGNIWINTSEHGIYFINNKSLASLNYNRNNGLAYEQITCIEKDFKDRIYFGNQGNRNLNYLENGQIKTLLNQANRIYSIMVMRNQDLVFSSCEILSNTFYYAGEGWDRSIPIYHHIVNEKKLTSLNLDIKTLYKLNDQEFLAGGHSVLYHFSLQGNKINLLSQWKFPGTVYSISANKTYYLLGTTQGVYSYDGKGVNYLGNRNPALANYTRSIVSDKQGGIWIADDKYGLSYVTNLDKPARTLPELKKILITHLTYDSIENELFASSSQGVWRIKLPLNKTLPYAVEHITTSNGLGSMEANCVLVDRQQIYVGTAAGVTILPKKNTTTSSKTNLYCTQLRINGRDTILLAKYDLTYKENNVSISLVGLSFQSEGNIDYEYRLIGADNQWKSSASRTIEFSDLTPGNYIFQARAKDINKNWCQNEILIQFIIKPPFWNTWWFKIVSVLTLMFLMFQIIYRRAQASKQRDLKEAIMLQQLAEVKLEALQSQLNSHFIFNSLNAIQKFILNNDEISASEYMNKFANLIRGFLESSKSKTHALGREIELLKLYVDMEQLRFEDKFECEWVVDSSIDLDDEYPTNILQPFVENAILHGLIPLKQSGKLTIEFEKNDSVVICIIDDNGVGFPTEGEMKVTKNRQSYGTQLIYDRIEHIVKGGAVKIKVNTYDKRLLPLPAEGTRVVVEYSK